MPTILQRYEWLWETEISRYLHLQRPPTSDERRATTVQALRAAQQARHDAPLLAFVEEAWGLIEPQAYVPGWHIEALCAHLTAVTETAAATDEVPCPGPEIKNLLVNVPPRTSKSLITSVFWPAWVWLSWPACRFLYASYSGDLALRDAVYARTLMQTPWYMARMQTPWTFTTDQRVKSYYANSCQGYRISTSVGSMATGVGGDIRCLAPGQRILTTRGWLPIEDIVQGQLPVKVAAFSHETWRMAWQPIMAYHRHKITGAGGDMSVAQQAKMLYTLQTTSGACLRLTGNHPVYVVGRGYIPAHTVSVGDRLLYAADLPSNLPHLPLVPPGLHDPRRAGACGPQGETFLLPSLLQRVECGGAQSGEWAKTPVGLPHVQTGVCQSEKPEDADLLLHALPQCGDTGETAHECDDAVHGMWDADALHTKPSAPFHAALLFPPLCRQRPPGRVEGGTQRAVHPWQGAGEVPSGVERGLEECGAGQRWLLHGVSDDRQPVPGPGATGSGCASHRLQQAAQHPEQLDYPLQMVPWQDAWKPGQPRGVEETPPHSVTVETVAAVTLVGPASTVYNLTIAHHNNYFAEGLLLHNCGDDLHSTQEDFSTTRAEIVAAKQFWSVTMASRFTNAKRSCQVLVGQRVARDDVSGDALKQGTYAYLKIPMEYEPETAAPPTPLGWVDPRTTAGALLCPERFGEAELAPLRRSLGHRYFTQFQQRPTTDSATLFPRNKWRFFDVWPDTNNLILVQSWDARFGDEKESGSFVAGHLWARLGPPAGGQVFLLDRVFARLSFTETVAAILALSAKWPGSYVKLLEAKANGPAIYDFLRSKVFGLVLVQVDGRHGSKLARAEAVAMVQKTEQRAWLPSPRLAPWVEEYLDNMENFPGDPTDDTDATSQAWQYLVPPTPAKDLVRAAEEKRVALHRQLALALQRNGHTPSRSRTHV